MYCCQLLDENKETEEILVVKPTEMVLQKFIPSTETELELKITEIILKAQKKPQISYEET